MAGETATSVTADVDPAVVAASLGYAAVLGAYASWIAADLLPRWLVLGLSIAGVGYLLYGRQTVRGRRAYAAYVLAGLLVLTPVLLVLPDAIYADRMGVGALWLVVTTTNALLFVVFAAVAALVAFAGYRQADRPSDA